jgi:hypothetical protein
MKNSSNPAAGTSGRSATTSNEAPMASYNETIEGQKRPRNRGFALQKRSHQGGNNAQWVRLPKKVQNIN